MSLELHVIAVGEPLWPHDCWRHELLRATLGPFYDGAVRRAHAALGNAATAVAATPSDRTAADAAPLRVADSSPGPPPTANDEIMARRVALLKSRERTLQQRLREADAALDAERDAARRAAAEAAEALRECRADLARPVVRGAPLVPAALPPPPPPPPETRRAVRAARDAVTGRGGGVDADALRERIEALRAPAGTVSAADAAREPDMVAQLRTAFARKFAHTSSESDDENE
jgi:peptidoglycan hydrolase-like protein with peptidoglycan-binding domain